MKKKRARRASTPNTKVASKKPAKKAPKKSAPRKKKAAPRPAANSPSPVEAALRNLLASFDEINDQNAGLTDTDVREILARTVIERLVERKTTPIPDDFQMMEGGQMSPAHDLVVKHAITAFITAVELAAEWQSCSTDDQRKALIARDDVTSS
jgi:hypothetical protein